jgi:hypothetical protein
VKVKLSLTLEVPYQVPTRHEMFERPRRRAQQPCCTGLAAIELAASRGSNPRKSNRARARPARPGEPARAFARRGGGPGDRAAAAAPRGPRVTVICVYPALCYCFISSPLSLRSLQHSALRDTCVPLSMSNEFPDLRSVPSTSH